MAFSLLVVRGMPRHSAHQALVFTCCSHRLGGSLLEGLLSIGLVARSAKTSFHRLLDSDSVVEGALLIFCPSLAFLLEWPIQHFYLFLAFLRARAHPAMHFFLSWDFLLE
jgi:hypothetical protein